MNDKTTCRRHFRLLGYKGKYNQSILDYIVYRFDLFENNDEKLAIYVLNDEKTFSSLVDAAVIIGSAKPDIKIGLCVPYNFNLPIKGYHKAIYGNVEVYTIKGNRVDQLSRGLTKSSINKLSLEEIEKTLININRICKNKWEFNLFKIKKNLLNKLSPLTENEKEFIYQIATISSIIEAIDIKEYKQHIIPVNAMERKIIKKNQSISMIELFLKKNKIKYDSVVINNMRELRDLRNIPPIHQSDKFKRVCRKFIKKIPDSDSDWTELSEVAFKKFRGSLILLRNILK